MAVFEHFSSPQAFLCTKYFIVANVHACIGWLLLIVGWLSVGWTRYTCLRSIRRASKLNPFAFVHTDVDMFEHSRQASLPKVSVIMACKGVRSESISNWKSQLISLYGGEMEYVFVTEHQDDPAYSAIQEIMKEKEFRDVSLKLVVAGYTFHNSQKIHNQLAGIRACSRDSKYVLFLDDDVSLHPGTVRSLVDELQNDEMVFAATGYSFDLPDRRTWFSNYCTMVYRLLNLSGFGTKYPAFVWGGCMMFRLRDFVENRYGIIDNLRDGGYSDDVILGNICRQEGRKIVAPPCCIFPTVLDHNNGFGSYWNFCCRQMYVLDMFQSHYGRWQNRCLLFANVWGGFAIYGQGVCAPIFFIVMFFKYLTDPSLHANASFSQFLFSDECRYPTVSASAALLFACAVALSLAFMMNVLSRLVNTLSPKQFRQAIGRQPIRPEHISPLKILGAWFVHTMCAPIAAILVHFHDDIMWSGIRYTKKNGRVHKVERFDPQGRPFTVDRAVSMERAVRSDTEKGFPTNHLKTS